MKKIMNRIVRRKSAEPTRDELLRILKLRGELTVLDLCKSLKVTHNAVRRYLAELQADGVVSARICQQGKGRPVYKFSLTEAAAELFPNAYEDLAGQLLDTVFERSGHKGVMDFLRLNNDRVIASMMPDFINLDLRGRLDLIKKYFVERGYMTDWVALDDGNFFLFHQNCAIMKTASRYRQLCILEPRLIECLLGVRITRQQYMLKGQPLCGYLIYAGRPLEDAD